MREGTSGFWVSEKDGEVSIGYADYGVSAFGGGDFEKTYYLDKENSKKFVSALQKEYRGSLKEMIEAIDEPNVGINFDPANFLYYNNDDPALLVDQLVDKILTVHCKDAVRPAEGEKHGKETVLGQGATNFCVLLKRILDHGFNGPLIIERELAPGPEQEHDFRNAVQLIKSVMKGEK